MSTDKFTSRHIGPRNEDIDTMLSKIGVSSIDEFYYHEIEYKTFDKVCYSIKEHEYDKEPMKGFGLCTFGQMQHLLEDGWSGWWSKYLNS